MCFRGLQSTIGPGDKSQYHNAVACGSAVNSVRSSMQDIGATHTLPRCGTDLFATDSRKSWPEKQDPKTFLNRARKGCKLRKLRDETGQKAYNAFTPSFFSRYCRLTCAHSFGVRDLSGTSSSSITAQPLNFTSFKARNTAGRSTRPRPSSTKR